MICLDTNAVIAAIRGGVTRFATRYDRELPKDALTVSSIVLFEIRYGISKSARVRENEARLALFLDSPLAVLDFEAGDSVEAGGIRAALGAGRHADQPL